MAELNVKKLNNGNVTWDGDEYAKAFYPIQEGDIVQAFEEDDYFQNEGFYEVEEINGDHFVFLDDDGDERERRVTDDDFIPYRKVPASGQSLQTIVIDQPVRLILKGNVTIEIQGGVTLA